MKKNVLSEQALYHGQINMPNGFEINSLNLSKTIFDSLHNQTDFIFNKDWDKLNIYIIEFLQLNFKLKLINKDTWGSIYMPNEISEPLLDVDPVDLRNSPDFTLLYGINTKDCHIKIFYDDNRRKGRYWDIELKQNGFVMFPSTCLYNIINKQNNNLNFIQTITYEYV